MNAPVGEAVLRIAQPVAAGSQSSAKRFMDLFVCLAVSPLVLLIAAPITFFLILGGGQVLYSQPRVGRGGRTFSCLKFRSMVCGAEARLRELLAADPRAREEWDRYQKLSCDPRITWFGRFLRALSLDELPQFINVLRGDMSIVGPRPIMIDQIALYGEGFPTYCSVKPGITGLWQVNGRNNHTFAERVRLDCRYVDTWSVPGDLLIMLRTIPAVIAGKGVK